MQDEQAAAGAVFFLFHVGTNLLFFQFLGAGFVAALDRGEIVEQLPDAGILGARGRFLVELASFELHGAGLLAHGIQPERLNQPNRLALHEAADILAADQTECARRISAG